MHRLTEEIIASRDWRMRELEALKKMSVVTLSKSSEEVRKQYNRMCVPYIYAHWEGFIVQSFRKMISYINSLNIPKKNIRNELYAFSLVDVIRPLAGKQSFDQVRNFVEKFVTDYEQKFYMDTSVLTAKSNLNYAQIEDILNHFGMSNNLTVYKQWINQMINIRNKIAHGENGISIDYTYIESAVGKMYAMYDIIILEINDYLEHKRYMK